MSARQLFSDPGGGVTNAPIGSEAWAQRVRLEMQAIVDDLPYAPERFERYLVLCKSHRAWRLMNKRDGSRFRSLEEFCEYEKPWGLGRPWKSIKPYLVALHGKAAIAAQVAPLAPNGTNQHATDGGLDNIKPSGSPPSAQGGTGADYLAARLRRDHPEIADALAEGRYRSVRAAARAAGIVKPIDPVAEIVRRVRALSTQQIELLRIELRPLLGEV